MLIDELLICYFLDSFRPLKWIQFNKKEWIFNDLQEIIEKDIDAKAEKAFSPPRYPEKAMTAIFVAINQWKESLKKILRSRKHLTSLLIIIVEVVASLASRTKPQT